MYSSAFQHSNKTDTSNKACRIQDDQERLTIGSSPPRPFSLKRIFRCCVGNDNGAVITEQVQQHQMLLNSKSKECEIITRQEQAPAVSKRSTTYNGSCHKTEEPKKHFVETTTAEPSFVKEPCDFVVSSTPEVVKPTNRGIPSPLQRSRTSSENSTTSLSNDGSSLSFSASDCDDEHNCINGDTSPPPPLRPLSSRFMPKPPLGPRQSSAPVTVIKGKDSDNTPTTKSSWLLPKRPQPMQRRCTTNATNNSRHRRMPHDSFVFSTKSLHDIYDPIEPALQHQPPPTLTVIIDNTQPRLERDVSALAHDDDDDDDDDSYDEEYNHGFGVNVTTNYCATNPFGDVDRNNNNGQNTEWMMKWITQQDEQHDEGQEHNCNYDTRDDESFHITKEKKDVSDCKTPVYFPNSSSLDDDLVTHQQSPVLLSGWVAFSLGEGLLEVLLYGDDDDYDDDERDGNNSNQEKSKRLQRSNVAYLTLNHDAEKEVHTLSFLTSCDQSKTISFDLTTDMIVQSREISGKHGRAVFLKNKKTNQTICSILPVSLPNYFFEDASRDVLVDDEQFDFIRAAMFTPFLLPRNNDDDDNNSNDVRNLLRSNSFGEDTWGDLSYVNKRYAPDEQHDVATNVLFSLDAMIKKK